MKYTFKIIDNRKHLEIENNFFPILNTFLLSEAINFDDIIEEVVREYEENSTSYFSGNLFSLELENKNAILYNKFTDEKNIIPANLFIEIFREWNK
ncbi:MULTISPECIES: hypothetical protein [unclassified Gemella]|uniref:hypothetical protein n=1 Tax=unclassified Gemella TaxID=2624949 RepID=UPI00107433D2|nr:MULTISPECIES: hypothetical protein [unclassified Gemella]MBF0710640.1 hypothetical protein [Gemella sp. GL1.1]MBF0746381.1 hypothetical protein [Gemella sp. 19428wG2_WT2a]NYS27984.1 hypothetical protein [Gemella sp. GL1]TFU60164.1 hypothetical protein E4T67_01630 [Gemella sp. WT2a]